MTQILLNNISTTIASAVAAGDVTINVAAGDGAKFALATGGNTIRATLVKISGFKEIAWEIVDVTARSTDALTVTRARESTTALTFAIGDLVDVRVTAQTPALRNGESTQNFAANALTAAGGIQSISASALIGYGAGAGGTVVQATSKSTAVTLNKPCGQITMNNEALAAGATVWFKISNNLLVAGSTATALLAGGVVTATAYRVDIMTYDINEAAIYIRVKNESAGALSEALIINVIIHRGSTS